MILLFSDLPSLTPKGKGGRRGGVHPFPYPCQATVLAVSNSKTSGHCSRGHPTSTFFDDCWGESRQGLKHANVPTSATCSHMEEVKFVCYDRDDDNKVRYYEGIVLIPIDRYDASGMV